MRFRNISKYCIVQAPLEQILPTTKASKWNLIFRHIRYIEIPYSHWINKDCHPLTEWNADSPFPNQIHCLHAAPTASLILGYFAPPDSSRSWLITGMLDHAMSIDTKKSRSLWPPYYIPFSKKAPFIMSSISGLLHVSCPSFRFCSAIYRENSSNMLYFMVWAAPYYPTCDTHKYCGKLCTESRILHVTRL